MPRIVRVLRLSFECAENFHPGGPYIQGNCRDLLSRIASTVGYADARHNGSTWHENVTAEMILDLPSPHAGPDDPRWRDRLNAEAQYLNLDGLFTLELLATYRELDVPRPDPLR